MTWQGAGGTGGTDGPGRDPGEGDDATRVDWPAAPAPTPPAGDVPSAPPPAAPAPGEMPPPPGAPVPPPVLGSPVQPWAPADSQGAWGTQPVTGGAFAVPGAPGLVYAGAIPRAAAWIVDSFLIGLLVSIITIPFAANTLTPIDPTTGAFDASAYTARSGVAALIAVVLEAVYFILLWTSGGRGTLGMRLFKLQVGEAATGNRLELFPAVKRWLAYGSWLGVLALAPATAALVGFVQLVWTLALLATTASSPTKQGLHDKFAGSAVVRPASEGNGLAVTCLVAALVLPILAIVALISLFFMGGQVSEILSAVGESV